MMSIRGNLIVNIDIYITVQQNNSFDYVPFLGSLASVLNFVVNMMMLLYLIDIYFEYGMLQFSSIYVSFIL